MELKNKYLFIFSIIKWITNRRTNKNYYRSYAQQKEMDNLSNGIFSCGRTINNENNVIKHSQRVRNF